MSTPDELVGRKFSAEPLGVKWIHGSPSAKHNTDPDLQVHWYDDHTVLLRQNKAIDYEAPFLFLLFGDRRAVLIDTGATAPFFSFISHSLSPRSFRPPPILAATLLGPPLRIGRLLLVPVPASLSCRLGRSRPQHDVAIPSTPCRLLRPSPRRFSCRFSRLSLSFAVAPSPFSLLGSRERLGRTPLPPATPRSGGAAHRDSATRAGRRRRHSSALLQYVGAYPPGCHCRRNRQDPWAFTWLT